MKETLKKYWRFLALSLLPVGLWIVSYFTGDRTPLWICGLFVLAIWAGITLIDAVKDEGLRFALWTSLAVFVVAHWLTNNRTFSLIFGLLIVLFYFGLKWANNMNERRSARKCSHEAKSKKPIEEFHLPGGKSVFPAVKNLPPPPECCGKAAAVWPAVVFFP
jgi:hypothetical protein